MGTGIELQRGGDRIRHNKKIVLAGNVGLMKLKNISYEHKSVTGTVVHVAIDGAYSGYIVISDELKPDSKQAIFDLKTAGINKYDRFIVLSQLLQRNDLRHLFQRSPSPGQSNKSI